MSCTKTPLQIIQIRAPQFATDPRISDLITMATCKTGDEFGDCKNEAIALRVMHWLTKDAMAGGNSTDSGIQTSGQIISEKEGDLSRSYGKTSSKSSSKYGDLATTGPGQELIELMDACLFSPRNRLGTDDLITITRVY